MKRFYMLFLAAAAAFISCHESPLQEPVIEPEQNPQEEMLDIRLEAGILTKTVLEGTTVLWEKGDQLALVFNHKTDAPHVNTSLVSSSDEETSARASFNGRIPMSVSEDNGYEDLGFAVYPHDAVAEDGTIVHKLPAVQTAMANGSFPSGCNLASTALSLADFREDGKAEADFTSAMSLLRLALSEDIESVTLTGTVPLTGVAPVVISEGTIVIDADGKWSNESTSALTSSICSMMWPDACGSMLGGNTFNASITL